MRRILLPLILAAALAAAVWCWMSQREPDPAPVQEAAPENVVPEAPRAVQIEPAAAPAAAPAPAPQAAEDPEWQFPEDLSPANCFSWGPFDRRGLMRLEKLLEGSGFIDSVVVVDRYLPDCWIAWDGPYASDREAKDRAERLRRSGFAQARPILRGTLAPGVEVQAFADRASAEQFVRGAPKGLRVRAASRVGEPSDLSDVQFRRLKDEQKNLVHSWSQQFQDTSFDLCVRPPKAAAAHSVKEAVRTSR